MDPEENAQREESERPLAPGLYLVATPIGNLEDMTMRGLRVLRSVDRIACEDTRQTQKLLHHYGIRTPTVSYHRFNEKARSEELVEELKAGGRVAVVSDAGTPGIADPGGEIVAMAIAAGVAVYPVPGANAAVSALIGSGMGTERWVFGGFLPATGGARRTVLEGLRRGEGTYVFYEAPHRILETLGDVAAVFGEGEPVVVARELTKMHEEFLRGMVGEVRAELAGRDRVRGEMVLLLAPRAAERGKAAGTNLQASVRGLIAAGASEKDALKQVARERGMGKSEVYREWQRELGRR